MPSRNSRRTPCVAFDMVAELASTVAERAYLLAIIVVTRTSQLLYYMAWLCGLCVGTLRAYMEGAT
eukprot:3813387-Amphidinium_carterae.1